MFTKDIYEVCCSVQRKTQQSFLKSRGKGVAEENVTAKPNMTKLDGDNNTGLYQVLRK